MAITLGLVEAVDDDGVYVSMPGSRGVLRGPYRSLSTVAVGTTVLVASTDDGEQVVVGAAPGGAGIVDASSFGATGDGVTDDADALQAAVTAIAGRCTLRIPPGVYILGDTLTVPSDTHIVGYGATFKASAGTRHRLITCIDTDGVTIEGLTFDLNKANVTAPGSPYSTDCVGIVLDGTLVGITGTTLRDVTIVDGHQHGLYATAGSGLPLQVLMDNVTVTGCNIGAYLYRGSAVEVQGGDYSTNEQDGLYLDAGSGHSVRGARASTNARHGIVFDSAAHSFSVHGCHCDGNGTGVGEGMGIVTSVNTHHWSLTGNVCRDNKTSGIQIDPNNGTATQVDAYGTVSGNVCCGSTAYHGIYVTYARYVTVTGNVCQDNYSAGIMASCAQATIVGNQLVGNNYGVYLSYDGAASPSMGTHVVGPNLYAGNTTDDLYEQAGVATSRLLDP